MVSPFAGTVNALASQFSGAVSPFPDTPRFAAFKQAPRTPVAAPSAPSAPVIQPDPMRPAFGAVGPTGFDGARQAYGGGAMPGSGARQPFEVIGGRQPAAQPNPGAAFNAGGALSTVGGAWAALDQHNNEIGQAAAKFGVPANLLKSMINRESSGNWARDNRIAHVVDNVNGGEFNILPFVGIKEATAASWGLDWNSLIGNKQAQIDGMAKIVKGLADQYGGFENAAAVYFGGEGALSGSYEDAYGMIDEVYQEQAVKDWKYLDSVGGGSGNWNDGIPTYDWQSSGLGNNQVIQEALEFVGTPYVWGGIPGANQDPRQTGWDCSGMTYYLDQKYGNGTLRQGSHYQFQQMQQEGRLFTDLSQLQEGDLVFIDTGWQGGAGAELNRAGHVGIYIGNGQILHAANAQQGTIVSPLAAYGSVLGAAHQSFSGGGGGFGSPVSNNPYRVAGRRF